VTSNPFDKRFNTPQPKKKPLEKTVPEGGTRGTPRKARRSARVDETAPGRGERSYKGDRCLLGAGSPPTGREDRAKEGEHQRKG